VISTVRLEPTGAEFPVDATEDILTAALRHGIPVQYGCRQGKCARCKHWLVQGDVDDSRASVYALTRDEREDGAILLCCTLARSDLTIEIDDVGETAELPPMEPPSTRVATVVQQCSLTTHLTELRLRISQPLPFRAGQYVELTFAGTGERRTYSIVNPPSSDTELTFCIKPVPRGLFSTTLSRLLPGTAVSLEGPFGTMFLRETGNPIIAVAIGSGIAPILSMLCDAADRAIDIPVRFYYGAPSHADLVYLDRLTDLARRMSDFQFIPCFSREPAPALANARDGRVTRVIAADLRDASGYDAYLCGAPSMCDTVGELLELKGLPASRIHADRFFAAAVRLPVATG
jgi:propane monooxygenase reductase subunit